VGTALLGVTIAAMTRDTLRPRSFIIVLVGLGCVDVL
jgi:hypothetical protein